LILDNSVLKKSRLVYTSIDENPDSIKAEFDALLAQAYTNLLEQKASDESNISLS
jgi:hypothetical protein